MIGVAVGLGNVWRFPYMMGQYGGSAFLVVYIAFVLIFAIPALAMPAPHFLPRFSSVCG
ncbi:MAG: hypothetical protein HQ492_06880 [Woeseiaceae bacterium]|nr:hypothetical protein [Woeseiaceae bacterium]